MIIELAKCHDEIRNDTIDLSTGEPYDPECKKPEEIEEWLKNKRAYIRMINDKIDFTAFNEDTVR